MNGMGTYPLLLEMIHYDFYDWDNENEDIEPLFLGMPKELLESLGVPHLYETWGFDAVNNENAETPFTVDEWKEIEDEFFNWLRNAGDVLFPPHQVIVTPELYRDWLHVPSDGEDDRLQWFQEDQQRYYDLLTQSKTILPEPDWRDDYRGAVLESFEEVEIMGRMSVKGVVPLLFFSDRKYVMVITDYLTLKIIAKNQQVTNELMQELKDRLNPTVLKYGFL